MSNYIVRSLLAMDNTMITERVGNRIRELRSQTGLSQEKFALKIGMDRTYLRVLS